MLGFQMILVLVRNFRSSVVMVMDGGDTDALSEILIRLPAKSLIRFKSVSKLWLSLISSPHFCRRLARRNSGFLLSVPGLPYSSDIGFVSLNGNPSETAPPPFKFVIARQGICRILQSCNGLLLCHNLGKTKNFVFNPTTRQYLMLPQLIDIARSSILSINLAFDPLKSPYYKVVSVRSIGKDDYTSRRVHYQIEIYSNEFGIWRNSGDPFTVPNTSMFFYDGVFSNGVVHWISPVWDWIYFNVEEERLEVMPRLPFVGLCGKRWFRYFGESFSHLHLVEIVRSQTTQFKVYELEKDNSNWFSKFNVDLDPIVNAGPNGYSAFMVLSIFREEDDDESSLLLHIPGEIISYKFKDKSFRKLHDLPPCSCNDGGVGALPRKRCSINVYQYIESMACVRTCSS